MPRLFTVALTLVLAGWMTTAATAADKKKKDPDQHFAKLDTNGDKKLSADEFKGKRQGDAAAKAEKQYKRRDKDGDGSLSLEEFKATGKKKKAK